jgi:hypothetical protein
MCNWSTPIASLWKLCRGMQISLKSVCIYVCMYVYIYIYMYMYWVERVSLYMYVWTCVYVCSGTLIFLGSLCMYVYIYVCMCVCIYAHVIYTYVNNALLSISHISTGVCKIIAQQSNRLKRFVFQRCRLLLVVNVQKKHAQCKYATLYGYETVARRAIILHTPVRKVRYIFTYIHMSQHTCAQTHTHVHISDVRDELIYSCPHALYI